MIGCPTADELRPVEGEPHMTTPLSILIGACIIAEALIDARLMAAIGPPLALRPADRAE
jgi:hypothetical protein